MSRPWPYPQSSGANNRDIIVAIEYALDTTPPLQLTGDFIEEITNRINAVHIWLRSPAASTATYNAGLTAVLFYIRTAERLLAGAVVEYKRKNQSQTFFKFVQGGQEALEQATNAW
jgi:hypothetical protein